MGRPLARLMTGHGAHEGCSGGDEEGAQSLYHVYPGVIGILGATLAHDDERLELKIRTGELHLSPQSLLHCSTAGSAMALLDS